MSSYTAFGNLSNRVTALEEGPSGAGGIDYIVRLSADSDPATALTDALEDYIGVLRPNLSSDPQDLVVDGFALIDGLTLRFFNNGLIADGDLPYDVVLTAGAEALFTILPQEAYTMIYRVSSSDWVILPGIINAKSKPSST
jgi:hypothetical protein